MGDDTRDERGLADAIHRHEAALRASIRRLVGSSLRRRVDTDDVFQGVALRALEGWERFEYRSEIALEGWLHALARTEVAMLGRYHGAQRRDVRRQRPLADAGAPRSARTTPTRSARRNEARHSVRAAIADLPAQERELMELRSIHHLAFDEIARRLRMPSASAARAAFARALAHLARRITTAHGQRERAG